MADTGNHSIRRFTPAAVSSTPAGPRGNFGSTDGSGAAARFYLPSFLVVDRSGSVFVTDSGNATIRKITPTGVTSTFVGLAGNPFAVDGTGSAARFSFPFGLAIDSSDTLYANDSIYGAVRRITPAGVVTTIAGQASPLLTGSTDGTGSAARFGVLGGAATDRDGNVIVTDNSNQTVRRVTPMGVVTTIAGLTGARGAVDGVGSAARFSTPYAVAVDSANNIIVADANNHAIRRIAPDGTVTTVAGFLGTSGTADGAGSAARFNFPSGVAVDEAGVIFVADTNNNLIRRIAPGGVVTTIGGRPAAYIVEGSDGSGTAAVFAGPIGIAVDRDGALYIAEGYNSRIVKGVPETRPVISRQPQALAVVPGTRVTFGVAAAGGGLGYQWYFNGNLLPGATGTTYTISASLAANAGNYAVAVTNSAGSITSVPAALSVVTTADTGRIANLAIRTQAGTGGQTLIVGFSVGGAGTSGTKPILIRGVGPALGAFGLTGFLADPKIELYANATGAKLNENDNWGGAAPIVAAGASVGAVALGAGTSRDAALHLPAFGSGTYSVQVSGVNNATGVALAEIYDLSPAATFAPSTPRLVNVSARTFVGTDGDVLIAGFYIGGRTAKTVLIRAIGPTLTAFGVAGALADPRLELFSGTVRIEENDNWGSPTAGAGGDTALAASFSHVGAFPLSPTSRDAALLVTLPPGSYTAQVSGVGDTTGVALVEVYDVP